ncbi:hypothetical protein SD70_13195 [Gordoniibacillus kamchatkensis]|uniref:DinB-like domain-containing protein n=2 Tax=Gordoniibacillus kamchatkensis TaxID=1590651 RepID=A0ABR5AI00_9BACL|nr:hypothetical protein SD70_13195 [Paenibacillus sp. VKM B-2647]
MEFSRKGLFRVIADVTEEEARVVPQGFNNSILWNAGHIVLSVEQFLFFGTHRQAALPSAYMGLFWRGTKPSEWKTDPPSLQDVVQLIKEQTQRVKHEFQEALDASLPSPMDFPGMPPIRTVSELMCMTLYHEALHIGYIKALLKSARAS